MVFCFIEVILVLKVKCSCFLPEVTGVAAESACCLGKVDVISAIILCEWLI